MADGGYQSLATLLTGDFFGEIAALTGTRRTADVIAISECSLLQLPAQALHSLMDNPTISQLFLSKMSARLAGLRLTDLPRFSAMDPQTIKELRSQT
jgi:CRP-like cAMP-binding protein